MDPAVAANAKRTIYVKSGFVATVSVWYEGKWTVAGTGMERRTCFINATFIPNGRSYRFAVAKDPNGCGAAVFEYDNGTARLMTPDKVAFREVSTPFFQTGSWCSELTPEQRNAIRATR
jgi:hypothetical protein